MELDLSGIAKQSGRETTVAVSQESCALTLERSDISIHGIEPFALEARNSEGKRIHVRGQTTVSLVAPCDRCLTDVTLSVPLSIDAVYELDGATVLANEDDPCDALSDNILAVDVLLAAELLCSLPSKVLCRDDCKGLCPVCGQNANLISCGCERTVLDPRMAKVLDVFQAFKEV